jgi:hypothetical protein
LFQVCGIATAGYSGSGEDGDIGGHKEAFRDGKLTQVLSNLLGKGMDGNQVQRAVANVDNQQYGPPNADFNGNFQQKNEQNLNYNANQQQPPQAGQYGPPPQQQQNFNFNVNNQQQQYGSPPPPQQKKAKKNEPPIREYGFSAEFSFGDFADRLKPKLKTGPRPPPPVAMPQGQYGPPPQQQQGNFNNNQPQQYGPPPQQQQGNFNNNNQQQYGPPPQQQQGNFNNNQQQQYGPPPQQQQGNFNNNQQQQYGPPPQQQQGNFNNNQQYGPPPQQQLGNFNNNQQQQYGPPPQGNFNSNQNQYGPPAQQYGPPTQQQSQFPQTPQTQYGPPQQQQPQPIRQSQVDSSQLSAEDTRFVYLFAPPPEPSSPPQPPQVIPYPSKPDKKYEIIFVKSPEAAPPAPVEIQLPPPTEQKTLVYLLVKKPNRGSVPNIKFTQPKKTMPSPPEVFFVKYRDTNRNNNNLPSTSDFRSFPESIQDNIADMKRENKEQGQESVSFRPLGTKGSSSRGSSGDLLGPQQKTSGGYSSSPIRNTISSGGNSKSNNHYTAPGSRRWE